MRNSYHAQPAPLFDQLAQHFAVSTLRLLHANSVRSPVRNNRPASRHAVACAANRNSGRIQVFDQDGNVLDVWSHVIMPWGLSITANDEIWVCGSSPHWWYRHGAYPEYKDQIFMRFSTDGHLRQMWQIPLGDIGDDKNNPDVSRLKPGEAVGVHCIATDSAGNLYVGEIYSERAQKFSPVTERPTED